MGCRKREKEKVESNMRIENGKKGRKGEKEKVEYSLKGREGKEKKG